MHGLKIFLHFVIRLSLRNLTFTLVSYAGLTLGFVVAIVLSSYLLWEFSYDGFHHQSETIYRVTRKTTGEGYQGKTIYAVTPGPLAAEAKQQLTGIDLAVRLVSYSTYTNISANEILQLSAVVADPDFFSMFSWRWIYGEPANFKKDPNSIILTESTALKLFGTVNPLGQAVPLRSYKDHGDLIVQGVIRDFPTNSHIQGDLVVSLEPFISIFQPGDLLEWRNSNYFTYFKLHPGTSVADIEENLNAIQYAQYTEEQKNTSGLWHTLQPLRDIHFNEKTAFDMTPAVSLKKLYIVMAILIAVMILACANYTNMAIAQSINRAREIGIRKAAGAQSKNIILQFLGETTLQCVLSFGAAFLLASFLLPYFNRLLGVQLAFQSLVDCLPYLLGVVIAAIVIAGLYPASVLASYRPVKVLKIKGSQAKAGGHSLRDSLVVFQFVVSAVLVIVVTIFQAQLNYLLEHDPGFTKNQILNINLSDARWREKLDLIKEKILQQANVHTVSFSNNLPHHVRTQQGRTWKTEEEEMDVNFYTLYTDENFIDLYGLKIISGRTIMPGKKGVQEFIINETAARQYGWSDPVGMEFKQGSDTIRIVGVVTDFHLHSRHLPIQPLRIGHYSNGWISYLSVGFRGGNPKQLEQHIESTLREISERYPVQLTYFDENYAKSYESDLRTGEAVQVFSLVSLVIASLGLYGLVLFAVNTRTKEIGIRKVLGASWNSISWLLGSHFFKLILVSFGLASIPAYYISYQWLSSFSYRIDIDMHHFVIALGLLLTVVILTMTGKLFGASKINVAEVLRKE